jgi:hypothetical protein
VAPSKPKIRDGRGSKPGIKRGKYQKHINP